MVSKRIFEKRHSEIGYILNIVQQSKYNNKRKLILTFLIQISKLILTWCIYPTIEQFW